MTLLFLILRSIFRAAQLCLSGLFFLLAIASCTPSYVEPSLDAAQSGNDSTHVLQDSIMSEIQDTTSLDSIDDGKADSTAEQMGAVSFPDVDVSPNYWRTQDGTTPISVRKPKQTSEEWFLVEPAFTVQGNTIYQNSCVMFAVYVMPSWSASFKGEIRLAYLDAQGNVIGQSAGQSISGNKEMTLAFFDYLTFAPQRIRILPVVRFAGRKEWIAPQTSGYYNQWHMTVFGEHSIAEWPDEDWGYTILPNTNRLLLNDLRNEWMPEGSFFFITGAEVKKGEEFTLTYTLANPSKEAVRGTLTLKDEHGFTEATNCYRPCIKARIYSDRDTMEWSNFIGTQAIDIPAGAEGWRGTITGKLTNSTALRYRTGCQHLYFQPEGSSEAYLLAKDWSSVMYHLERGESCSWGSNVTFMFAE